MGLFSLGCEGCQGHRAQTLHSAPHWARFPFSASCLRLKVMMPGELGCAPMLEEGTQEGLIAPRPLQTARMTHRRVRAGFAGDPCPLSPPSLPVRVPRALPCLAAGQRPRLSRPAAGKVKVLLLLPEPDLCLQGLQIFIQSAGLWQGRRVPLHWALQLILPHLWAISLFLFISLRVFPAVNRCWQHRSGGDGIQLPIGILAVTCRSSSPSPYRGWIHPTNRENNEVF